MLLEDSRYRMKLAWQRLRKKTSKEDLVYHFQTEFIEFDKVEDPKENPNLWKKVRGSSKQRQYMPEEDMDIIMSVRNSKDLRQVISKSDKIWGLDKLEVLVDRPKSTLSRLSSEFEEPKPVNKAWCLAENAPKHSRLHPKYKPSKYIDA